MLLVPQWMPNHPWNQQIQWINKLCQSYCGWGHRHVVRVQTTQQTPTVQENMATLIWEWNWKVSTWDSGESARNKHNILCQQTGCSKNRQKDVTYGQIVWNYQPGKAEPNKTRLTVGGDRINCMIAEGQQLLNSVISTKGAKIMMMKIKKIYLNTPLKWYEYLHLKLVDILPDVAEQ